MATPPPDDPDDKGRPDPPQSFDDGPGSTTGFTRRRPKADPPHTPESAGNESPATQAALPAVTAEDCRAVREKFNNLGSALKALEPEATENRLTQHDAEVRSWRKAELALGYAGFSVRAGSLLVLVGVWMALWFWCLSALIVVGASSVLAWILVAGALFGNVAALILLWRTLPRHPAHWERGAAGLAVVAALFCLYVASYGRGAAFASAVGLVGLGIAVVGTQSHRYFRYGPRQLAGEPVALQSGAMLALLSGVPIVVLAGVLFWIDGRCQAAHDALSRLPPASQTRGAGAAQALVATAGVLRDDGDTLHNWLAPDERSELATRLVAVVTAAIPAPVSSVPPALGLPPRLVPRVPTGFAPGTTAAGGAPLPNAVLFSWSPGCGKANPDCDEADWVTTIEPERAQLAAGSAAVQDWTEKAGAALPADTSPAEEACRVRGASLLGAMSTWAALALCPSDAGGLTYGRLAEAWLTPSAQQALGPTDADFYFGPASWTAPTMLTNQSAQVRATPVALPEPAFDAAGALVGAYARAWAVLVELRDASGEWDAGVLAKEPWLGLVPESRRPDRVLYVYFTDISARGEFVRALRNGAGNKVTNGNVERVLGGRPPRRSGISFSGLYFAAANGGGKLVWSDVGHSGEAPGLMLTVVQ